MKNSATLLVVSTLLTFSACSKSGDGGPNPGAIGNQYSTNGVGGSANPAMYGFWQADRVENMTADASGAIHLSNGRVMAESLQLDQSHVEITGFPDDLVRSYQGSYQFNGQTLILGGQMNGQYNYAGQNVNSSTVGVNGVMNGQQGTIPYQNGVGQNGIGQVGNDLNRPLVVTLVNSNELTINTRHFHRIDQTQFYKFRSQISQISAQFGNSNQIVTGSGQTASSQEPYVLPPSAKKELEKARAVDRKFPDVAMPSDWNNVMAPTPTSAFEMHMSGNRHEDEVYQRAQSLICGSSKENGLVVKFATSNGSGENSGLVSGVIEVPELLWKTAKPNDHKVYTFVVKPTSFTRPFRVIEQLSAKAEPFETWGYDTLTESRQPILNADLNGPGCTMNAKVSTTGMLRGQIRCESVPSNYYARNSGVRTDTGTSTVQFACKLSHSTPNE